MIILDFYMFKFNYLLQRILIFVLFNFIFYFVFPQRISFSNPYTFEYFRCDSIHIEDLIIGVNWHIGNNNVCGSELYLTGDLLGDKYDTWRPLPAPKPILIPFDSISLSNNSLFSSVFHEFDYSYYFGGLCFLPEFNSIAISKTLKDKLYEQKQRHLFVKFPAECELSRITIPVIDSFCDSLKFYNTGSGYLWLNCLNDTTKKNNHIKFEWNTSNCLTDPWIDLLQPNLKREHPKDYHKYLELDTFPNYYPIPISDSWRNTDHPYFKIISKAFYLMLFKCRITYASGQHMYFAVPNLNLDLNSEISEERELCRMQMIPAYQILNIQNIEPFPVSRLKK
jgi:hypothetical protein